MTREFYKTMQRDIEAWERKYGDNIYSGRLHKELHETRMRWASFK